MQWDAFNRLCALLDEQEEPLVYYAYDATNRRVVKDGDVPAETHYVYAGWRVLEERDDSEALFRQFVWGNYLDEALVMDVNGGDDVYCTSFTLQQDPDTRYYYLQNTLYSVYALTDEDADVVEAYEYDPYGRHFLLTDGDSDGEVEFDATDNRASLGESLLDNPITFTGQRHDPESDLHYYKRRYYDTVRGRFISRDPIRNPAPYEYVSGSPIRSTDPRGLFPLNLGGYSEVRGIFVYEVFNTINVSAFKVGLNARDHRNPPRRLPSVFSDVASGILTVSGTDLCSSRADGSIEITLTISQGSDYRHAYLYYVDDDRQSGFILPLFGNNFMGDYLVISEGGHEIARALFTPGGSEASATAKVRRARCPNCMQMGRLEVSAWMFELPDNGYGGNPSGFWVGWSMLYTYKCYSFGPCCFTVLPLVSYLRMHTP